MKILSRMISRTLLPAGLALALSYYSMAQQPGSDRYHTPAEINAQVNAVAKSKPAIVKVHTLGKGYKGNDYQIIEIGKETKSSNRNNPAVLVVADLEGTSPLASEGALFLIRKLLNEPERLDSLTWYVLACGNPDGAERFFQRPLIVDGRNLRPWNDDMDEQTEEDGPEDLNGDGYITQMRIKDPDGVYIPDDKDPRMMKRADPVKGEKGIYKLYLEGIDNDGDGQYNEDGPGGTNIGITFPFLYGYNQPGTGAWSGSEPERLGELMMRRQNAIPDTARSRAC